MIFHDISWYFSDRLRWSSESSVHPILVSWGMISFGSSGCCCTWPMLTCWLCWRGFEVPWGPMACWSSRRIACWKATPQGALSRFRVGDLRLKAGWYRWIKWLCDFVCIWRHGRLSHIFHISSHTHKLPHLPPSVHTDPAFQGHYRRKFRSQTSENMDRWKSRGGKSQRREEKRKEDQRRERVRGKKMQMREKVEKLRKTVFFQWFVAPEGRKVGSLKRVRSHLARWEMKKCTPLWREAHF